MTRRVAILIFSVISTWTWTLGSAPAGADTNGVCFITAVNSRLPQDLRWDVQILPRGVSRPVTIERKTSLVQAIHFVQSERNHGSCRPLAQHERPACQLNSFR